MESLVLQSRYLETLEHCSQQLSLLVSVLESGNSPTVDSVILARAYVVLLVNMRAISHLRSSYIADISD